MTGLYLKKKRNKCISVQCLFVNGGSTHSETQTCTIGATSGASDYAVKPNQFPAFGLMDAIIFMDLKPVSVPQTPSQHRQTHMQTLSKTVVPKPREKKWIGKKV